MTITDTRQQVATELKELNDMLKKAHNDLAQERYDPKVKRLSTCLREHGLQVRHAVELYNQGKTEQARTAMPTRQAIVSLCRQAADLQAFDYDNGSDGQSEPVDVSDQPGQEASSEDSTETDQEMTTSSDDESKPADRPMTARHLRRQPPANPQSGLPVNADALKAALFYRSPDKEDPLTLEDVAEAARISRWITDRRRPSKRPPHRQHHSNHQDY